ncbi:MAG: DoxX family protein [Spirosomataceae bacterium]
MFRTLLHTAPINTDAGLLILRVGAAFFLATHGYDKLLELIAGNSSGFPDPFHVSPVVSHALVVAAEFFSSILLALGLFTRFALLMLIANMTTIALVIHAGESLGDKEHAFLFLIPFVALFLTGPGRYSLDARLFK